MLIVLSGLPGTGKSSIARELARRTRSLYLRIDTIEQAIRSCGNIDQIMEEGYEAACRVAEDNLKLGTAVIADAVNAVQQARDAWADVAKGSGARLVYVQVLCSDETEHRRRVETRFSDVANLVLPTWEEVKTREFHEWTQPRIVVDTAGRSVDDCVDDLVLQLTR